MKYLVMNEGPNRAQRNAYLLGDKVSATPNRSAAGRRMRSIARTDRRLAQILRGRDRVNRLFLRAGIALNL